DLDRETAQKIRACPPCQIALGQHSVCLSHGLNKIGLGRHRGQRRRFGTYHPHQQDGATTGTSHARRNGQRSLSPSRTIKRNKNSLEHIYSPSEVFQLRDRIRCVYKVDVTDNDRLGYNRSLSVTHYAASSSSTNESGR